MKASLRVEVTKVQSIIFISLEKLSNVFSLFSLIKNIGHREAIFSFMDTAI